MPIDLALDYVPFLIRQKPEAAYVVHSAFAAHSGYQCADCLVLIVQRGRRRTGRLGAERVRFGAVGLARARFGADGLRGLRAPVLMLWCCDAIIYRVRHLRCNPASACVHQNPVPDGFLRV